MKALLALLALTGVLAAEPEALTRLRESWGSARDRALAPVDQKYREALEQLMTKSTKQGDLDAANAVAAEIKNLNEATDPFVETSSVKRAKGISGGQVIILAKDPSGYRLVNVRRGDLITIQYKGGKWKSYGNVASHSPDDKDLPDGDENRLVIATGGTSRGPGRVIEVIPPGTAEKPFQFTATKDYPELIFRIHGRNGQFNGPGWVTYLIK